MTDHLISGLVAKRAEVAGELEKLRQQLVHIDGTLRLLGYEDPKSIRPHFKRKNKPLFGPGELMALVGQAERAGCDDAVSVTRWVMLARNLDEGLYQRVRASVKDCRKRLNRKMPLGR
jgi:hypothetical protein